MRVYTCDHANKVDDSTVASVSATKRDQENLSNCSTGQALNVEKISPENDHMCQLEIECTNGEAKVILLWSYKIS